MNFHEGEVHWCKLVSSAAECTYKANRRQRRCHCYKIADMQTYLFDDTLGISDIRTILMTVNKEKAAVSEVEHHGSKFLAEPGQWTTVKRDEQR